MRKREPQLAVSQGSVVTSFTPPQEGLHCSPYYPSSSLLLSEYEVSFVCVTQLLFYASSSLCLPLLLISLSSFNCLLFSSLRHFPFLLLVFPSLSCLDPVFLTFYSPPLPFPSICSSPPLPPLILLFFSPPDSETTEDEATEPQVPMETKEGSGRQHDKSGRRVTSGKSQPSFPARSGTQKSLSI